jgi:hypothetical protein
MALNNRETGSNSSSPFVFLHGGAGVGWMWQPHLAQLTDLHSQVFELSRQAQEGKKASVVQVNKIEKWLSMPQKPVHREMEQCCLNTSLATS